MDALRVKGVVTSEWLVIPSLTPFMAADNVMATLTWPATRFLLPKNPAMRVFTKVQMVTPVPRGDQVKIVLSDTLASPQIAIQLHSWAHVW